MSSDSEHIFRARIDELARTAAGRDCFTFTDFLNPAEQSYVLEAAAHFCVPVVCTGGFDQAERVIARFGSPEELGYVADFPIALLHIRPLNVKFSDTLGHRDYLGAVLNLGIDRKYTGDILTDGTEGWLFAAEHMAPFIAENLTRVCHTIVTAGRADRLPEGLVHEPERITFVVPSLRLDAVIARAYGMSRKEVLSLFAAEKVFVNSRIRMKPAYELKEGDLISVRGYGRFRYCSMCGDTRKGNLRIAVDRY